MRIRQELLLGIGGVRALAALGISPGVVHLNEGHSAFASLELVRRRMEVEGIGADEAMRRVGVAGRVHDAHAGAGRARPLRRAARSRSTSVRCATRSGCRTRRSSALGRVDPRNHGEEFCMTVLALKVCHRANAVSSLHGHVSRAMWKPLYSVLARGARARSATSPTAST